MEDVARYISKWVTDENPDERESSPGPERTSFPDLCPPFSKSRLKYRCTRDYSIIFARPREEEDRKKKKENKRRKRDR